MESVPKKKNKATVGRICTAVDERVRVMDDESGESMEPKCHSKDWASQNWRD